MSKYLGIDWGEKRIGLSLAHEDSGLATPFGLAKSLSELVSIAEREGIDHLVIGLPRSMSSKDFKNDKFDKFIKILKERLPENDIKYEFIDERLTSVQADSLMAPKMKQSRDSLAAMIILQAYLDKIYDKN
jgi:putative holliday junction resolvase